MVEDISELDADLGGDFGGKLLYMGQLLAFAVERGEDSIAFDFDFRFFSGHAADFWFGWWAWPALGHRELVLRDVTRGLIW